jgi:hypothetical protein
MYLKHFGMNQLLFVVAFVKDQVSGKVHIATLISSEKHLKALLILWIHIQAQRIRVNTQLQV